MKALGIDFGERRIGLAISDPCGRLAVPLESFERTTDRRAAGKIATIAREERVELLVLGEPRNLDGTAGEAAERVGRFGRRLAAATGLPLERVDEALTSVTAAQRLREAGVDLRKNPGRIDAVAAQILLQDLLDDRRASGDIAGDAGGDAETENGEPTLAESEAR